MAAALAAATLAACGTGASPSGGRALKSADPVVSRHVAAGVEDLFGVACPTSTTCEAVGANTLDGQGVVVPITSGTPGRAQVVAGTKSLNAISCPTPKECEAVGVGGGHGVVVPVIDGLPGTAQPVSGSTTLQAIACSEASRCTAAGRAPTSGLVVTGVPNAPGSRVAEGTTSVNGLACPTSAHCEAVAATSNGRFNDVLVPVDQGAPGAFVVVPPGTSTFGGIACATASACVAVGRGVRHSPGRNAPEAVVVGITSGRPRRVTGVGTSDTDVLQAVSCAPGGSCEAVGTSAPSASGRGIFLNVADGRPGPVHFVPEPPVTFNGIACPDTGVCEAVGTTSGDAAVVLRLRSS